jgi:trimeric autotransporter adhesin
MKARARAAAATVVALLGALLVLVPAAPAAGDTAPADPTDRATPRTASAQPLPTVQINGVVWSQVVVGNTVYVGGEFTQARPAGAAAGTNQTARANLLAYDIRTGALLSSWAPTTNGAVSAVTASPDGSRIYVGGTFTSVNGQTMRRIAALNASTGALITSFNPNPDSRVRAIAATNSTVYFGGSFSAVGGLTRARLAAARASDGAVLAWAPAAGDGQVWSMVLSPDETQVLAAGSFTTVNGSSNPGYGMASLDAATGGLRPWAANSRVRNGGSNAAITHVSSDSTSAYATGYAFGGAGGNIEGTARMSWNGGTLLWAEDCHGDTYGSWSTEEVLYTVSHKHYCGNLPGGNPQTSPWTYYRGNAFTVATTQTIMAEYLGYANWAGTPAPSLLHWLPRLDSGSYTGQYQGPWHVTGDERYVVMGGEFPRVGNSAQQGLVRFALPGTASATSGIEGNASALTPKVRSTGSGQALVSWRTLWDRDNENLTYRVIRNGATGSPVDTRTVASSDWSRPHLSYLDTGLSPGSSVSYRVIANDPSGNTINSNTVNVTIAGSGAAGPYATAVTRDGPRHYWRFSEASGTNVLGYTGLENATTFGGVTRGAPGAVSGDAAATFNGTSSQFAANQTAVHGDFWYTVEAWFNTSTTRGGRILGFGSARTGTSSSSQSDRHLYMLNNGAITFGTRAGSSNRVLTSQSGLNNGQWHQAVGVVGPDGMALYVDGVRVGFRADTTVGAAYNGYWRVGGDNLSGWANRPTSDYFAGSIDEVAVYSHPLTGKQVRDHYVASGRSIGAIPTDAYGKAVYEDGPSSYWRMAETSGTTAADSSLSSAAGTYVNGPVLGGQSGIGLSGDRSATFDGSNDVIASNVQRPGPRTFTAEGWFRTSTSSGGKLFGFGSSRTGTSGTTDRHVYMLNNGRLRFGTSASGQQSFVESPQSYANGQWHHVAASQGPNGMRLYVDGALVASNGTSVNATYNGYWRVGGDSLSGWGSRPSSDYFAGALDEVAFYDRALTNAEVADHYAKAGGVVENQAPVASFSATPSNLTVAFNSSASFDPDGSIVSRSWNFGDGGTSTATNPSHTYASAGTYTVTLTVTDNDGATSTQTQQVTVTAPGNQAPTASFTLSQSERTIDVDGSGSSDPDGSIASYSWNWGDSTALGSGATTSHTYAANGTYTVTLTVTDNQGATSSTSRSVTVSDGSAQPVAADAFGRTVGSGWGNADVGGAWSSTGPVNRWSVSAGKGQYTMPSSGIGAWNRLGSVSAADVSGTIDFSVDKPITGGGLYFSTSARVQGTSEYRFNTRFLTDGTVRLYLTRVVSGTETQLGNAVDVPLAYAPGQVMRMRWEVSGSAPATLNAKIWKAGQSEPATPQIARTDTTAALQGAGAMGLYTYISGSFTGAPVTATYDDLLVGSPFDPPGGDEPPGPANQPPNAAFVVSEQQDLTVQVSAAGSSDPDGSIESYSWDWGDGTADGSGVTAGHAYAEAGSYTVTLTVTDDEGATSTATRTVTVNEPGGGDPPGDPGEVDAIAADAFARVANDGWGDADVGGAWSATGPSSRWAVSGGAGRYSMPSSGIGAWNRLLGVSARDVTKTVDFSVDKAITGGGLYFAQSARIQGNAEYRLNARLLAGGTVRLYVTRVINGAETQVGTFVDVPGLTFTAGDVLRFRTSVSGATTSTLTMKVWKVDEDEPAAPQITRSESTPAALQGPGAVGLYTYISGSFTGAPVTATFDGYEVLPAD